ncbi:MAG: sulfotransferase, partial [Proteobacteria bacterium]|nr:sulfotransferase [Pseudomonadota bacterium]
MTVQRFHVHVRRVSERKLYQQILPTLHILLARIGIMAVDLHDRCKTIRQKMNQYNLPSPPASHLIDLTSSVGVFVLGMHRSGTSALARVLGLMGADVGQAEELLPAHPVDNPKGYWERAEVNEINDALLAASGHKWNQVSGFDPSTIDAEAAQAATQRIGNLATRLNSGGKPWIIKDPRLCLLLPQWLAASKGAACVVAVRDPREIAASLTASARGTFTSGFVLALWEKYLHTLLMGLAGRRAVFVSYADLLDQPASQCRRLLAALRNEGVEGLRPPNETELSAFLDPNLRHNTVLSHVRLSADQANLAGWLDSQASANGTITVSGAPTIAPPDAELAEYETSFEYHINHGRFLFGKETSERLARVEAALSEHQAERERAAAQHAIECKRADIRHADDRARWDQESMALRRDFETRLLVAQEEHIREAGRLHERNAELERHAAALD